MEQLSISINQIFGYSMGVSSLIAILICALWSIFFNRIKEGQKTEFQKQIEDLKSKNEKLNYITKTQFETEFKMYQELSETSFNMLLDNTRLFPMGLDYLPEDKEEKEKVFENRYEKANESLVGFQNKLFSYAPFLKEEIYNIFEEFRKMCKNQTDLYPMFYLENHSSSNELDKMQQNCFLQTSKIFEKHSGIIKELREYLQSLNIKE